LNIKFHSIVGCLALTVACSDNACEIFKESVTPLDESLAGNKNVSVSCLVFCFFTSSSFMIFDGIYFLINVIFVYSCWTAWL